MVVRLVLAPVVVVRQHRSKRFLENVINGRPQPQTGDHKGRPYYIDSILTRRYNMTSCIVGATLVVARPVFNVTT